jgi:flagellar protein FliO/FliZ
MTIEEYINAASALVLVLALMGLIAIVFKRLNDGSGKFLGGTDQRLKVIEQKVIDPKHKMVLIRRDDVEHLVILSHNDTCVVETGMTPPKHALKPKNKKDIPLEI